MTTVNEIKIQADQFTTQEISDFLQNDNLVLDFTKIGFENRFEDVPNRTTIQLKDTFLGDRNGESVEMRYCHLFYGADTQSEPLVEELTALAEKFPNAVIHLFYEGEDVGYNLWHSGKLQRESVLDMSEYDEYDMDDIISEVEQLKLDVVG